jgi:hypothetical protein
VVSMNIVMRPCGIIVAIFLVMFVVFLIAYTSGFADMKVTQLHDFINQDSDATLVHKAVDGADLYLNLDDKQ